MKLLILLFSIFLATDVWAVSIEEVSFLHGCWGMTNEYGSKVTEDWLKNSADTMLGISQTISSNNETVEHEFLSISWDLMQQTLVYQAIIDNYPMAPFIFDRTQSTPGSVAVFVNEKNDFPKAITYRVQGAGTSMAIFLSGNDEKGEPFAISYELQKEDCASRH